MRASTILFLFAFAVPVVAHGHPGECSNLLEERKEQTLLVFEILQNLLDVASDSEYVVDKILVLDSIPGGEIADMIETTGELLECLHDHSHT